MTSLHEPVMELVRASLDPSAERARTRQESPVCQVVIRAAESDLASGGMEKVIQLAIGTGMAAAGLTAWLAQERGLQTDEMVAKLEQARPQGRSLQGPVLEMLKSLLTGPPGMQQTAEFMVTLFHHDEEAFYDLIVDLGSYTAVCIDMLNALEISSVEKILEDLEDMLVTFFAK
ncbi:hypothetical protein [Streptomyces sp. NPDC018000]|uniref:hypothetical protein n=1 Tax=Streptomyces sp. NPDC018000 TaxID=3365028 RepID=UPI0037AC1445